MPYINTVGASMLTSTHVLYKGLEYIQHLLCVCRCASPHCTLGFGSWSGHEQLIWTWTHSCCAFKHMYMQCLIESNRYRPWRLVANMWYTVLYNQGHVQHRQHAQKFSAFKLCIIKQAWCWNCQDTRVGHLTAYPTKSENILCQVGKFLI